MKSKVLFLCGMLTSVVCICTVILGGFLWNIPTRFRNLSAINHE